MSRFTPIKNYLIVAKDLAWHATKQKLLIEDGIDAYSWMLALAMGMVWFFAFGCVFPGRGMDPYAGLELACIFTLALFCNFFLAEFLGSFFALCATHYELYCRPYVWDRYQVSDEHDRPFLVVELWVPKEWWTNLSKEERIRRVCAQIGGRVEKAYRNRILPRDL